MVYAHFLKHISLTSSLRTLVLALALGVGMTGFALSPSTLHAEEAKKDPVVLRIDGKEIHYSEVIREINELGAQVQQLPPQLVWQQVTQGMVVTELLTSQPGASKLADDPEVKAQLAAAQEKIIADVYARRTIKPKITEEKVKAKYDSLIAQFKPEEEVRARHILVETEKEAQKIIKDLKEGGDFSKLATAMSKDIGTARQGGDLGYFSRSTMVKPFADAVFAMKVGETSEKPIKTQFGWHVVRLEDRRKSPPPSLDSVRSQVENQVGKDLLVALVKDLESKATIERFNPDGSVPKKAEEKPASSSAAPEGAADSKKK